MTYRAINPSRLTPHQGVAFDHVAGSLEMHFTPLLYGCNQIHVDAGTILSDPMVFLRLIDGYVSPSILRFDSNV
jgi:hypothetical protein